MVHSTPPWSSQNLQKPTSLFIQPAARNFPKATGKQNKLVHTIKTLLQKADDPHAVLLAYQSTPVHCGYSPAELLMNRPLCSTVPIAPTRLQPAVPD